MIPIIFTVRVKATEMTIFELRKTLVGVPRKGEEVEIYDVRLSSPDDTDDDGVLIECLTVRADKVVWRTILDEASVWIGADFVEAEVEVDGEMQVVTSGLELEKLW